MSRLAFLLLPLLVLACTSSDKDDPVDDDDDDDPIVDADGDGYDSDEDCDDDDADVNPGADDRCDGVDNDCNGRIDDNNDYYSAFFPDADGDGYGAPDGEEDACSPPEGFVENDEDCDDTDDDIHPGVSDPCDGVDNDCDGKVDGDSAFYDTFYEDGDGDGYGDPDGRQDACTQPAGFVENDDDCGDSLSWVYPGAEEWCHPDIDSDCDPSTDAPGRIGWYTSSAAFEGNTVFNGTAEAPAAVSIDEDATLYVCEGTWYANVTVEEGVTVEILSVRGENTAIFDGGGTGSVFTVVGDGSSLSLDQVEITNGSAVLEDQFGYAAGGGIHCSGASTISLSVSQIHDNTAQVAGGIYGNGCQLLLDDTDVTDHSGLYSSGIIAESGAHLEAVGGGISRNTIETSYGGGLELYDASAELESVSFSDNTVYDIYVSSAEGDAYTYSELGTATLSCDGSGCE